ncbi:MAG: FxsA family protein [Neobacillus sp.]
MRYLFLLIIIIPAADIGLLLFTGKLIGALPTLFLILFTGVVGAYLAKKEGIQTIRKAQEQLRNGQIPGEAVLDGICILVGATLLITPGFITDILGFLMLFPPTRTLFKFFMKKSFRRWINKGRIKIIK